MNTPTEPDVVRVVNGAGNSGHSGGMNFVVGYIPIFLNGVPMEEVLAELRELRERVANYEKG